MGFENMRNTLVNTSFELCVFVQLQENPCTEPVEQADVNWQTPHRLVARTYIPKGEPPRYDNRCDNTAMHPYRTLTDHMPLGSLQRIRNTVYSHAKNFWRHKCLTLQPRQPQLLSSARWVSSERCK